MRVDQGLNKSYFKKDVGFKIQQVFYLHMYAQKG